MPARYQVHCSGADSFRTLFNPKSIVFFVSVVPGFVRYEAGDRTLLVQIALFGAVYVAIATIIHAFIVGLASQLGPWLMTGSRQNTIRRILSLALVLVAAFQASMSLATAKHGCWRCDNAGANWLFCIQARLLMTWAV
jgi:hypothetical protein